MKRTMKNMLAVAVTTALCAPMAAMATNGMFQHGFGAKSKGMAGAGVALSQDSIAPATNPAGLVNVGSRMDVGAAIFMPIRSATVGMTESESGSEKFVVPHFGYSSKIDSDSSWGVAVVGAGGMNTDYDVSPFGAGQIAGIDLKQMFIMPTYSRKMNAQHSYGVSAIIAYQLFETSGSGFFSNDSNSATGFGIRLGWEGQLTPELTMGAAYQPKIGMSKFDDYEMLFASSTGKLDIPANWTLGVAYKATPDVTIAADYQMIQYSTSKTISDDFHWDDMGVIKIGAQMNGGNGWVYRVGVSNGDQPIDSDFALNPNYLAPGVMETHITAGFTKSLDAASEINFAFMFAPENEVKDTSGGFAPGDGVKMNQYDIELSYSKMF